MQKHPQAHPAPRALRHAARVLLPLAALLCVAHPARAQLLIANTFTGDSYYNYNTAQGVTASGGNSGGSTGTGNPVATSYSNYAGGNGPFAATGNAAASADYATGGLHARAFSDGFYGDAAAAAELSDTVTFHIAGATASTVTYVTIDLRLDGTISQEQSAGYLYGFKMFGSGSGASVGWTTQFYDSPTDARNYVGWAVSGGAGVPSGFESWELLAGSATEKHFRGVLAVIGASKEYGLSTGFSLRCAGGTDCDFGNSAHLSFDLPTGVSFTSASGLLLTGNAVPAVPEPQTYALMLAGLAAIGAIARRRRR